MGIKEKVMTTLLQVTQDVTFLSRDDDGTFPFVVFNITEVPVNFEDDDDAATLFLVAVNIFSKPEYNFESMKIDIIKAMKDAGFKKQQIPPAEFLEKENVYNQPLAFSIYKENQEEF